MSTETNNEGAGRQVLMILVAVILAALCYAGWLAARAKCKYATVRAIIFPTSFILTQAFGLGIYLCLGWVLAACMNNTPLANFIVGSASDMALLGSLFNERTTPLGYVALYQFILWLAIGRRISRSLTLSMYDSAIQSIGVAEGIHPAYVRQAIAEKDEEYADAWRFYFGKRKPPLIGVFLVFLSGTPLNQYYY